MNTTKHGIMNVISDEFTETENKWRGDGYNVERTKTEKRLTDTVAHSLAKKGSERILLVMRLENSEISLTKIPLS